MKLIKILKNGMRSGKILGQKLCIQIMSLKNKTSKISIGEEHFPY